MRISLVQNRDCANFVVSCLNHTLPLINAFILNSPDTLNCPVTAPALTDQPDSVSKANPSQIQTQNISQPVDRLILPSSSLFSMIPMPTAPGHPAEQWIPVHTQCCGSGTQDIPPASPASHPGTQAVGQGCHTHSPTVLALEQCQELQSAEVSGSFPFGLKESPNPQGWRWEKKPSWRDADQHRTLSSSRISCQYFRDLIMPSFSFSITPSFSPPHLYYHLKVCNL